MENNRNEIMIVKISDRPELIDQAAEWFSDKWGISAKAYAECMREAADGDPASEWLLAMDGDVIVSGLGVIENDFHNRPDLTPNVCAVYTLPEYRGRTIAGRLLNTIVEEFRVRGISPLYLITDHDSFYERYGWEFFCMVQSDEEDEEGEVEEFRMYIHK